jgi:uncharacterized membrane protein YeaQ/YmgE (transglycosylase-associated protein family)
VTSTVGTPICGAKGFILTTALGIAGAFVATFIGQTIGWYRLDQSHREHRCA